MIVPNLNVIKTEHLATIEITEVTYSSGSPTKEQQLPTNKPFDVLNGQAGPTLLAPLQKTHHPL